MKIRSIIVASVLLAIAAIGLYAFQQPPTVSILPAIPSTVYVNNTTTVTINAQITDSRVIQNGVNVLQIDPLTGSQTVIGTLNGSGQTFTITIRPNTATPQLLTYQVSAEFQGLLKRSLSLPITIAVAPSGVVLPPDPGPAGMITLAGIDSDGDGVRDDVQRWIAVTYPNSAKIRAALTQEARATQQMVLSSATESQALAASNNELDAGECTMGLLGTDPGYELGTRLRATILNTADRTRAYLTADALTSGSSYRPASEPLSLCQFNPNALPN